jgi:hypothetical protein
VGKFVLIFLFIKFLTFLQFSVFAWITH